MSDYGRIWFAKSPWPQGHRLAAIQWSGRLDDRGLWFDLHLQTAAYEADHPGERAGPNVRDYDWADPAVWHNYGRCTMSSTKWFQGGFLVGTADEPLDWGKLGARAFHIDPLPVRAPSFHIYLLGHDRVANHRIRFTAARGGACIDWSAQIGLGVAGTRRFRHRLSARTRTVPFRGFRILPGLPLDVATDLLAAYTVDPSRYRRRGDVFLR